MDWPTLPINQVLLTKDEEEFLAKLESLKSIWDLRERCVFGLDHQPSFHSWFIRNKSKDFCEGCLREAREPAGQGGPLLPYYRNLN